MTTDAAMIAQLEDWMKGKEGEGLEFKKAENSYSFTELCKYCSAVANEGGGKIILGVTDARPRQVVGTKAFDQPERTRKGVCEQIPLAIDSEEIHHPECRAGSRVLVFLVPPRPLGLPVKYEGRYWMRKEDSLAEMSEEKLRAIFAESGHDFSADSCVGLTFDQLDPETREHTLGGRDSTESRILPSCSSTLRRTKRPGVNWTSCAKYFRPCQQRKYNRS